MKKAISIIICLLLVFTSVNSAFAQDSVQTASPDPSPSASTTSSVSPSASPSVSPNASPSESPNQSVSPSPSVSQNAQPSESQSSSLQSGKSLLMSQDDIQGDYTYDLSSDSTYAIIAKYNGSDSAITLPSEINSTPVKQIGQNAFSGNTTITSVTIPSSYTDIGDYAFDGCTALNTISFPSTLQSIGKYVFQGCTHLAYVQLPNGLTSIGNDAFKQCTSLTSITIPGSVTKPNVEMFYQCSGLSSVILESGVSAIDDSFFKDCTNLKTVSVPDSVTSWGTDPFSGCTNVVLYGTVGSSAENYSNANSLPFIKFDAGTGAITGYEGTPKEVVIPSSINGMGVSKIVDQAFVACDSMATITIPACITSIGTDAFMGCPALSQFNVDSASAAYSSVNGVLFNKAQTTLIAYPAGETDTDYSVPGSLTTIKSHAFYKCANLASVTIPSSVIIVEGSAFTDCFALKAVNFEGNAVAGYSTQMFNNPASGFTIYYDSAATGWLTPTWNGYPCYPLKTNFAGGTGTTVVEINTANFPDDVFRSFVGNINIDKDQNGILSDSEIAAVTNIKVNNKGINSLQGIEYFTALQSLSCGTNELTSLDISQNKQLTTLDCTDNQLQALNVSSNILLTDLVCDWNRLETLDVSKNTALSSLSCMANDLSSLDVSNNTLLTVLNCRDNINLSTLDISKNTALTELYCINNKLSTLDVSKNTLLKKLHCSDNKLSTLDVSKNIALNELSCGNNNLRTLDIHTNTALTELWVYNLNLSTLDTSNNTLLWNLQCPFNDLSSLDLSNNKQLQILVCNNNLLGSLDLADLIYLANVYFNSQNIIKAVTGNTFDMKSIVGQANVSKVSFDTNELLGKGISYNSSTGILNLPDFEDNLVLTYKYNTGKYASDTGSTYMPVSLMLTKQPTDEVDINATNFPDPAFRSYIGSKIDKNSNGKLSSGEIASVTTMYLNGEGISSLKGIEYFNKLWELECNDNNLTNLDISKNTLLEYLSCENNKISEIDVSKNTVLKSLDCCNNKLNNLDISKNASLIGLYCSDNQLGSLDVSKNTLLTSIECNNNNLKALNTSANTLLTSIECNNNNLKALNTSANTSLTRLYCYYNQLDSLDMSKNILLTDIECDDNNLSALNISTNTLLTRINCRNNKLTQLDLSSNTALTYLDCDYNSLSTLDVSHNMSLGWMYCTDNVLSSLILGENVKLSDLFCIDNKLNTLNLTQNTGLTYIDCDGNYLTTLDISQNPALVYLNCSYNKLNTIVLGNSAALWGLECQYNNLKTIDTSKCAALSTLSCENNEITGLDISKNSELTQLFCTNNLLAKLDVSNNAKLGFLCCDYNNLSFLNISNLQTYYNATFGPQNIFEKAVGTSFDMKTIVGQANLSNVKFDPDELKKYGVSYNNTTGILTFKQPPDFTLHYQYVVGTKSVNMQSGNMEVCLVLANTPISKITLNETIIKTCTRGSYWLYPTVLPTTANDGAIVWSSSDENIAAVVSDNSYLACGIVSGANYGTATITAAYKSNPSIKATCIVNVTKAVSSIEIDSPPEYIFTNSSVKLTATVLPDDPEVNKDLSWSSSNTAVAKVDGAGKVTGVGAGSATITAIAMDGSHYGASCTIKVYVPVTSLQLSTNQKAFFMGKTAALTATVGPSSASNKTVVWSSSDESVATVSSSGVVTGVGCGTAVITAGASYSNGIKATCIVTVSKPVTGITLSGAPGYLLKGDSAALTATVSPDDPEVNKDISWNSSNTAVAKVDATGKITGVGEGTAVISATAKDGSGVKAYCAIKVYVPVTSIQLSSTQKYVFLGKTAALTATVGPSSASNKTVVWSSSDESVATVSTTGVVTSVGYGTATITAEASYSNGIKATCIVTVCKPVTGITLNGAPGYLLKGNSAALTATVSPDEPEVVKDVSWSSSNTAVAKVDATGKITGVGEGIATITATAKDGSGVKASCTIKVYVPVTSIQLSSTQKYVFLGKTAALTATVGPPSASNKTVVWSSSDESVATVSTTGVVTSVGYGTATITAEASYSNGIKATCIVTVCKPVTGITLNGAPGYLLKGNSTALTATVSPDEPEVVKDVSWSSSNTAVAKVDATGKVTGVGEGTAVITATAKDGSGVKASCIIKV